MFGKAVQSLGAIGIALCMLATTALPVFAQEGSVETLADSPPVREALVLSEDFEKDSLEDLSIAFVKGKDNITIDLVADPEDAEKKVMKVFSPDGSIYMDNSENWSNFTFECRILLENLSLTSDHNWENFGPSFYASATPANRNRYQMKYVRSDNTFRFYRRNNGDNDILTVAAPQSYEEFTGVWHTYKIVADNGKFSCYLDNDLILEHTDTLLAGGTIGFDVANMGDGATYYVDDLSLTRLGTAAPTASEVSGEYAAAFNLSLLPAVAGDSIYYTLDGSDPIHNGVLYTEPIRVSGTTNLKMAAAGDNRLYSEVVSYEYTVNGVEKPTLLPRTGRYINSVTVTAACATPEVEIYYTTDESDPTKENGTLYSEPFKLEESCVVKVVAYKGEATSEIASSSYEIVTEMANEFYVAIDGDDENNGTAEAPFATVERARQEVRKLNQDMVGDIVVNVGAGDYYLPDTLQFDELDSGMNGYNVKYVSTDGAGKARLIGGNSATQGAWSPCDDADLALDLREELKGKVYKIHLPEDTVDFNTLYVGGERAVMARVQNNVPDENFPMQMGPYMITEGGGVWDINYKSGDLDKYAIDGMINAQARNDAEIAQITGWDGGYWNWFTSTIPIKSIQADSRKLNFFKDDAKPEMYRPKYTYGGGARYFLQGNLAFLDSPGEFFYSKDRKLLYYYPQEGEQMGSVEVIIPQMETIINLKGADKAATGDVPVAENQVHNLVFDGLGLTGTDFPAFFSSGWNSYDAKGALGYYPPEAKEEGITLPTYCEQTDRPQFQVGAITMRGTNNITVQNSLITNIGMAGVVMWQDNEHNTLQNSEISHLGYGGVMLDGGYPGVGWYNNNHTVTNMVIHDVGELVGHAAGLTMLHSGYNTFSHSEIYNSSRRGIFVGEWRPRYNGPNKPNDSGYDFLRDITTKENRFEYLYLHDLQHDGGDDGAIFFAGMYAGRNGGHGGNKNYLEQIVVDDVGANPSMTDIPPNGFNLDMGASGTSMKDMMIVNPQQYNFRYDNGYSDEYFIDNINALYGKNVRMDRTFDVSRMEFDKIGVNREEYPFNLLVRSAKEYADVYYREEFDNGLEDWWNLGGNPETTSLYHADNINNATLAGNGFLADAYYNDTDSCLLAKPLGQKLNKVVEISYFDARRTTGAVYDLQFNPAINSFARVDDGNMTKAMGVNSSLDSNHYAFKVGNLTRITNIKRTYGWHTFKWDYTSGNKVEMYIDGELVTTLPASHFEYIEMGDYGAHGLNAYDNVVIFGGADAEPPIVLPEPPTPPVVDNALRFPGKVEVESTKVWPGNSQKEPITGGGTGVGYIGVGNVFEYDIELAEDIQDYVFNVRHATNGSVAGKVEVSFNDADKTTFQVDLPTTGGWQNWRTTPADEKLSLKAGSYTMKVNVLVANINLDWYSVENVIVEVIPVNSVALPKTTESSPMVVSVGNAVKLPAQVLPENATDKTITWGVEGEDGILSVSSNGTITALKTGVAAIKATVGSAFDVCYIKVIDAESGLISNTAGGVTAKVSTFWDSRYPAANLIDGNFATEWVSGVPGTNDPEPVATLSWATPQTVAAIYAYDRINSADWSQFVDITVHYSGGAADTKHEMTGLSNDGKMPGILTFSTPLENVTSIDFAIDRIKNGSETNAFGFSELKVYKTLPADIPVHSLAFDTEKISLFEKASVNLIPPAVLPSTATDGSFTVELIQDEEIVRMDEYRADGVLRHYIITGLKEGNAVIRATATNGVTQEVSVVVSSPGMLATAIMEAEILYYSVPGDSEWHRAFRAVLDEVIATFSGSTSPIAHAAALEQLETAEDAFRQVLSNVEKTAKEVADGLVVETPAVGQKTLTMPIVPFGFMLEITEISPAGIINQRGGITPPLIDSDVDVTFGVTRIHDADAATSIHTVKVPGTAAATTYSINIPETSGGIVTADKDKALENEVVTLTVSPNTGYRLVEGSLKVTGAGGEIPVSGGKFTMPAENVSVSAEFELGEDPPATTYQLTVTGGSGSGTYAAAASVTATAEVPQGKRFVKWAAEGITLTDATANPVTFNMPANDVKLTAMFEDIPAEKILVSSITLTPTTLQLKTGEQGKLVAMIEPANATDQTLTWSSKNSGIVDVAQDGTLTAKKAGTTTITATANDGSGKTASCEVTVQDPIVKVSKVTLNMQSKDLKVKQSVQLKATITPANATNKKVSWKSSNNSVATVSSSGKVTAKKNGNATITVTAADGEKATAKIRVSSNYVAASSVKISSRKLALNVKGSATLKATVNPAKASNKKVVWASSNPAVASVSSGGKVTAKSVGKATITATSQEGGKVAKCTVTVKPAVSSVKISKTKVTLTKGKTATLKLTVAPKAASGTTVTWKTSNAKVATVSSRGKVKAIAKGTATISAVVGGKTVKCEVTVK